MARHDAHRWISCDNVVPALFAAQLETELNDLRKTAGIVADWLERSRQINPADMVSRNMDLAKELRMAAMPNGLPEPSRHDDARKTK